MVSTQLVVVDEPLKTFEVVKDYMFGNASPQFSTTRAHHRAPYPVTNTMIEKDNFAKFIKLEPIDRKMHLNEDMAHKLSPFKNRVAIKDSHQSKLGFQSL